MPHVIAKLWPSKSEQQKKKLAAEISKAVMASLHYGEESVSVAMEEVKAAEWTEKVCHPDILIKRDTLIRSGIQILSFRRRFVHRAAVFFVPRWRSA
jgi:4-oxalocrotonate tautomerase